MEPSPRSHPKYEEIDAAIRRLPLLHEQTAYASHLVDYLATMGNILNQKGGDGTLPPNFRPATKKMVEKQLSELARRAEALADKIDRNGRTTRACKQLALRIRMLNGPTLAAMSDAPPVVWMGKQILADTWYFQKGFITKLETGKSISSEELRFWALVANMAKDIPVKPQNVGRPENRLVHNVANELARQYLKLTGKEPTFTTVVAIEREGEVCGAFLSFVREIFVLLNIRHNPLRYASTASFEIRGRGRKK